MKFPFFHTKYLVSRKQIDLSKLLYRILRYLISIIKFQKQVHKTQFYINHFILNFFLNLFLKIGHFDTKCVLIGDCDTKCVLINDLENIFRVKKTKA